MTDYTMIIKTLVDKMLEPHGVDYNYVMSNPDIQGKKWYQYYAMTNNEFDAFQSWAIPVIMKHEKCTKEIAKKKFGYFNLQYGLRIDDTK